MTKETNNPTVSEPADIQEPTGSLEEAEVTTVEGTGTEVVQPEKDTATEKVVKEEKVKGVDLNKAIAKLSPEEQKAYKSFQADYTKKSQTLSEHEKKIAGYEDYYKNLTADPEISAILKSRQEKAAKEKEPDFSKMSDEEIFNYTVDKRVQDKLSELETKMDAKYGTYIQTKLVAEGNKLIKDFAKEKNITEEESRELGKYAVDHSGFDEKTQKYITTTLEEAYRIKYFDKIPEAARQEALDDLDLKKKANLELGSIPPGVTPVMPEKPTFKEAAKAAEKKTGLSWSKMKTE